MPSRRPFIHPAFAWLMAAGMLAANVAQAWTLNVEPAGRRVFLHVGNGSADADNGTINRVEVSLTGAQLLSGVPQPMTTDSTQSQSLQRNGFITCPNPSSQIMLGASYRTRNTNNGRDSATLSVTSPPSLTSASGDTIPFSEISWSVAAPGSPTPNVIPSGSFTGAQQTLATVTANTYVENCHSFTYANSAVQAAGTYNGRVTYTLTSP
jgi:hypothetical protein